MENRLVLRSFTEPTDVVILGFGYTWFLGYTGSDYPLTDEDQELIKTLENYERGITDDYTLLSVRNGYIETNGYVIVLTLDEHKKLRHLIDHGTDSVYITDFVGDITIGVIDEDTKEYIKLNNPSEDYYILYDLDVPEMNGLDREAKVDIIGTSTSVERVEIIGFEDDY